MNPEASEEQLHGKCRVLKFACSENLAQAAAEHWVSALGELQKTAGPKLVGLSGGRIATRFFDEIVRVSGTRGVTFENVHFFWADERCVPPESEDSNYPSAEVHLFGPLSITSNHIHRIRGEMEPATAARLAEEELRAHAPSSATDPRLDLVFLGMGEDGHVASLFPGEDALARDSLQLYRAVIGPKVGSPGTELEFAL